MGEASQQAVELNYVDQEILSQCQRESLFKRCLPFGVMSGALTIFLTKRGYLLPVGKLGMLPRLALVGGVSYVIGKASYLSTCKQKFLNNPESNLGKVMRANQEKSRWQFEGLSQLENPSESTNSSDSYILQGDFNPNSVDHQEGLNAYNQLANDLATYNIEDDATPKKTYTSYDQLRQKHHQDYVKSQFPKGSRDAVPEETKRRQNFSPSTPSANQSKPVRRNEYGDIIDE